MNWLDNLKLGYGGTKAEMERLLADATKLSGIEYDISSLADVYEAIHVVQEELGITGTTAKEASETISGSLAAAKAAWQNLITGVANENANFEELVSNFVDSATAAAKNILPRIEQALTGIGKLIEGLSPVIAEALPGLVQSTLPALVQAAVSIVQAFVGALGDEKTVETIIQAAIDIVLILADALINNLEKIYVAVAKIITTLAEALTEPETLEKLILAGLAILGAIVIGVLKALPVLLAGLGKVLENILTAIGNWMYALYEKGREIVNNLAKGVADAARDAVQWGRDLIDNFVRGIRERIQRVIDAVKDVAQNVRNYLGFSEPKLGPLSNFHTYAPDMMQLFAQGIKDNESLVTDQINRSFDFGVRTMDFGANATGGAGYNAPYGGGFGGTGGGEQTINVDVTLRLDDGTVLQKFAHRLRPYLNTEAALAGGVLS